MKFVSTSPAQLEGQIRAVDMLKISFLKKCNSYLISWYYISHINWQGQTSEALHNTTALTIFINIVDYLFWATSRVLWILKQIKGSQKDIKTQILFHLWLFDVAFFLFSFLLALFFLTFLIFYFDYSPESCKLKYFKHSLIGIF